MAAAAPVAATDAIQVACAREAEALSDLIACLKASGRGAALAMEGCEFAHREPFSAPLQGRTVLRFGERTQYGSTSKGVVLEGQHSAVVHAPKGGFVIFAGAYRTYGKLVVLETNCALRFILAGIGTLAVAGGETVAEGQAIGALSAAESSVLPPVLYVELSKSGKPVDPGPGISGP